MNLYRFIVIVTFILISTYSANAIILTDKDFSSLNIQNIISSEVEEEYKFSGLAKFYNNINFYKIKNNRLIKLNNGNINLESNEWLLILGRFNGVAVKAEKLNFLLNIESNNNFIDIINYKKNKDNVILYGSKRELSKYNIDLNIVHYAHLFEPLRKLAYYFEEIMVFINSSLSINWAITIIIFAIIIKLLFLPILIITSRIQKKVNFLKSKIEPEIKSIKYNFSGEEAHKKTLDVYKNYNVTPFYSLKPIIGTFFQIPILICIFNVLGEMDQMVTARFLWIDSFAYPDSIGNHSFNFFYLGNEISILPFLMSFAVIFATILFKASYLSLEQINKQKINIYFMAVIFFFLFYPFPSSMVFYWFIANILHIIQQRFIAT